MKKHLFFVAIASVLMLASCGDEPDVVATFDEAANTPAAANSAKLLEKTGTFESGKFIFDQEVNTDWGTAYYYGFVVSNDTRTEFKDWHDAYRVVGGKPYSGTNYAVFTPSYIGADRVKLASGKAEQLQRMYVNNTLYVENAIVNGDGMTEGAFTKDDWFMLRIFGWNGSAKTDSIDFYLAKDGKYVKEWTPISLKKLGKVTELSFSLTSSRNNDYGMTTPAYFAVENVK